MPVTLVSERLPLLDWILRHKHCWLLFPWLFGGAVVLLNWLGAPSTVQTILLKAPGGGGRVLAWWNALLLFAPGIGFFIVTLVCSILWVYEVLNLPGITRLSRVCATFFLGLCVTFLQLWIAAIAASMWIFKP
jgi:hypothetical protein